MRYANPDLWLRPSVNPEGFEYYEYILCYVHDVLCIYHNPRNSTKKIQGNFKLKDDKIEPPDVYLVETTDKMILESGKYCWTMLIEKYVKAVVTNFEEDIARSGKRLPLKCVTPLSRNFALWLEDYPELMADGMRQNQELIRQIRWAVDIGRLDILLETLMLLIYLAMPRVGHIK